MARRAVMAVHAFALFSAFHACPVALAIIFAARTLLASASACRNESRYSPKMAWIAIVGHLLGMVDLMAVSWMILAASADAVAVAESSLCKALAIEFETVDLRALASRMLVYFSFFPLLSGYCDSRIGREMPSLSFIEQFLKKILAPTTRQAFLIDEAERGKGIGSSTAFFFVVGFKHLEYSIKNIELESHVEVRVQDSIMPDQKL